MNILSDFEFLTFFFVVWLKLGRQDLKDTKDRQEGVKFKTMVEKNKTRTTLYQVAQQQ